MVASASSGSAGTGGGLSRGKLVLVLVRVAAFFSMLAVVGATPSAELYTIVVIHGVSTLAYLLAGEDLPLSTRRAAGSLLFDAAVLAAFFYYGRNPTHGAESFLIVYFLSVLFAALGDNISGSVVTALAAVVAYGILASFREGLLPLSEFLPKSAFLVVTSVFVAHLSRRAAREEQAERIATKAVVARERLAIVFDLARKLTATHDLDQLQRDVLERSLGALDGDTGTLMLHDPAVGDLVVVAAVGHPVEPVGSRCRLGEGIAGRAAQESEPLLLSEYGPSAPEFKAALQRDDLKSSLCAPLRAGEQLVGVLSVGRRRGFFSPADRELFSALANQAAVAIDNARLYRHLRAANSELSVANEKLRSTLAKLESTQDALIHGEKMASIGLLAAGVAHEFNNLIGGMYSLADYARTHRNDSEIVDRALDIVIDNTRRARDVTDGLLSFSRKHEDRRELVVLADLVESVLRLVGKELEMSSIRVERAYDPAVPQVVANGGQIQQVILNLVINAQHAIGQGGAIRLATVARRRDDRDWGVIEVTDDGCGITPEDMNKLFQPFFTTKGALGGSRTPGTGLGLSVSYNLIKAHGGTMEVDSAPGAGTTVHVWLPV